MSMQVSASIPPWLSHKAADTNEPFSRSTRTSRSIKHSSDMSPAPVKRRKANPGSQISPSRDIQASSDQRQSEGHLQQQAKATGSRALHHPRCSSGVRPLPIIPPITVTDTDSQALQLHTPNQPTPQEPPKPPIPEQALQPSPAMPGVRCEPPNSSGRSEAHTISVITSTPDLVPNPIQTELAVPTQASLPPRPRCNRRGSPW
ncbi:TPA: hypothetical protein ACH3X1_009483 [Trebouxia sp. C0004]